MGKRGSSKGASYSKLGSEYDQTAEKARTKELTMDQHADHCEQGIRVVMEIAS